MRSLLRAGIVLSLGLLAATAWADEPERRLLYVAVPGIRDYLQYGGHGLLVYDIDDGHKLVKRIATAGKRPDGTPDNVKGVCASAATGRIYISTTQTLTCLDLKSDLVLWQRSYQGGCDRMSMTPDGSTIYLPSFEKDHWHVVDAASGEVIARVTPQSGSHNTVVGLDGKRAYLAGLRSPLLTVVDTATNETRAPVGPFSASIRPFTVNGRQTLAFVNVNERLGFEIGDLATGEVRHRVNVEGFGKGPVLRHGCPSHGIGLTPDETELWVVDAFNKQVHIFDATVMPPKQVASLPVRDEPGWVTFTLKGDFAYPSTGDVFDPATRRVVAQLADEKGQPVLSEKMLEIDFRGEAPVRNGDQFGLGRVVSPR